MASPVPRPTPMLLLALLVVLAQVRHQDAAAAAACRPTVGAIRWDAWYGAVDPVGAYVQTNLANPEWQYRLPFFATVNGTNVTTDGARAEVMAQELEYAAAAGIGYWAFVAYPEASPLSRAIDLYLASPKRSLVNMTLIVDTGRLNTVVPTSRVVEYLGHVDSYQTVTIDGVERPLVYILGGATDGKAAVAALRAAAAEAGLPPLYVVVLSGGSVPAQLENMHAMGGNGISQYIYIGGGWATPGSGLPYAKNAAGEQAYWAAAREGLEAGGAAAEGAGFVTTVAAGWDPRPREQRPVPWKQHFPAGCVPPRLCWVEDPTMPELTAQTAAAVNFTAGDATGPCSILISAWNENDEGHWIVPSLHHGTVKLDAIRAGLQSN